MAFVDYVVIIYESQIFQYFSHSKSKVIKHVMKPTRRVCFGFLYYYD